MESQPDIFYGYLEKGVYGEFRHVPEPSPNKDKIGFIFGGKRYEFSRLAEPNKNKPESQEDKFEAFFSEFQERYAFQVPYNGTNEFYDQKKLEQAESFKMDMKFAWDKIFTRKPE